MEVMDDKKDGTRKEHNGKEDDHEDKPSIMYKWNGSVNGMVQIEDIDAKHCDSSNCAQTSDGE